MESHASHPVPVALQEARWCSIKRRHLDRCVLKADEDRTPSGGEAPHRGSALMEDSGLRRVSLG